MTLRASVRAWIGGKLVESQVYWRHIRHRRPEDMWWALRAPQVAVAYKTARRSEEDFYSDIFAQYGVRTVFDIGGNCGDKTEIFLSCGVDHVLLVEPDPHWSKIHQWRFQRDQRVKLCECAVSATNGTAVLQRFSPGCPLNTLEGRWVDAVGANNGRFESQSVQDSAEIKTVTAQALIDEYGLPDYCKIDVEGHELSVLSGIQQFPPLLSLEFNLPEFETELKESLSLISNKFPKSKFNFITEYSRGFELPSWVSADKLLALLEMEKPRYLELFVANR